MCQGGFNGRHLFPLSRRLKDTSIYVSFYLYIIRAEWHRDEEVSTTKPHFALVLRHRVIQGYKPPLL